MFLVGAGPGDPGLLTLKAARALRTADVLLHDYLASEGTVALAPAACEKIYVGKQAGRHTLSQDEINALIVQKAREGKRVVRLKGGDPFVFGRGGEEAQELREAGIDFEIIPGISSAIAAPAYAGIPVTHRSHNTAFTVLTGHEDPAKTASTIDWARFADPHQTLVLLMAMGNLAHIASELQKHGLPGSTPAAVIREGTRPTQQTLTATLATVAQEVRQAGLSAPAIVVVGDVVGVRESIRWFDTGPLFGKRVMITRPAAQSAEFAEQLLERGAQPVLAPLIEIGPPDDPHSARQAVEFVSEYRWVVFTSRNGVDAFFDIVSSLGGDARYLRFVRVAAIGPKTAAALAERGIVADLVPASFVGEALAAALGEQISAGERILLFAAQDARDALYSALTARGHDVDVAAAYKTAARIDPDFAQKLERSDIVTFASASAVNAFAENAGPETIADLKLTVACIGPVTAQAARERGLRVDVVARDFTVDGLLEALEETLESTASASPL